MARQIAELNNIHTYVVFLWVQPLYIHVGPPRHSEPVLCTLLVFPSSVGCLHSGTQTSFLPHNRYYVYTWP